MKHSINLRSKAVYNKIGLAAGRHSDSWEALYSTPQTNELSFKGDVEDRGTRGIGERRVEMGKRRREWKGKGRALSPSSPPKS